ncbi:hypothetical protein FRC10_001840 [Ceratobasidium sp. 414]|nr:hypothetical protein FRC10_001840 [Ceratobasidium sp. 414]
MSHGFYSQPSYQQYPPQSYAQPQQYPAGHSPQATTPAAGYFPTHARTASEFATTPQPYAQSQYPAQPYAPYGQQPQPPPQPFSPFTNPPTASYPPPASGYQAPPATAHQPLQSPNPPRVQHQHSHSVPTTHPSTASYSSYASSSQQLPHVQPPAHQTPYGTLPSAQAPQDYTQSLGHRPLPPPARSATVTSSYPTSQPSEFGQRVSAVPTLNRHSSFVPPVFGSRARSADPLPPTAYGDLARAPTAVSARSLDSGLVNGRPLPNAPGLSMTGSLPSIRERASAYEGDARIKDFTYPGRELPASSSPTKTGYVPYKRSEPSALSAYPSTSTVSSTPGSPPKPTYAAQPSANPRTAPFDPFGASRASQLASSPPKVPAPTFAPRNDSPTRPFPPLATALPASTAPPSSIPSASTWPREKTQAKPDLPLNLPVSISSPPSNPTSSFGSGAPALPARRPAPPFAPNYKRAPSPTLPAYSPGVAPPSTTKVQPSDDRDWEAKRQEWGRERDRAEDAIARAREVGRSFLQEKGVPEVKSEAAAIAEEYLARRARESLARAGDSPERPSQTSNSYSTAPTTANVYSKAPPTRRFQSPERRPNGTWTPSSPSRKDRWGEQKGDYVDYRDRQSPTRRTGSPEREGCGSPERKTSPMNSNPPPKSRSQRTFPSDGDYVQHRNRESFRQNGSSPTRHQAYASEPTRSPSRGDEYDDYPEEYDARPALQGMSRRERDEEEYERRSPERAPPPSRGNPGTPRAHIRTESHQMPREPQASPPRSQRSSPERPPPQRDQPRPQPRPEPRPQPQPQTQSPRPAQGTSPATSPRAPPQQPVAAPRQSMAMKFAAQAIADEGKPWPNGVPQLPRGPGRPEPNMKREPVHAPPPSEPPSETDLEEYYDEQEGWREATPVPARREPVAAPRREPPPVQPPRREPPPAHVPRKEPVPTQSPRREYVATPPRREPAATSPRSEPPRARPPPQPVYQEDQYEYDEPPQQWREPEEKPKAFNSTQRREPLRENTQIVTQRDNFQAGFSRPRPPARKETSRDAALRRPVPPPPPPVPAPRTPSPVQVQVPTITFGDEYENEPEPAPGVPSFSFDMADEPAGPVINVSSSHEPEPSGPRIQVDEIPNVNVIEDFASRAVSQQEQREESPVRRAGGLRCAGCDGAIAGRIVSAMGSRWHPHCFKCDDCGTLLEHVSSYEHGGKAYCHLDYHDRFAPRCYHCKTAIVDERFIALDDPALGGQRYYHELHFFCAECGDPFLDPNSSSAAPPAARGQVFGEGDGDDDVGFTVFNGHAYCEPCHVRLRMPRCGTSSKSGRPGPPGVGCGRPIREEAIEALGRKWHWKCFTCDSCKKPFEDPSFFQRDDAAFCDPCYRILLKNEF